MRAVVLVGGMGTRLAPLTTTIPKQMLPVAEVPMIDRVLRHLATHGITDAVLSLGYRPDGFLGLYPDHRAGDVKVAYAVEPTPLDTAGAIRFAAEAAGYDETFVVVNGDVITDLNVSELVDFHRRHRAEGTIHLVGVSDPSRFGLVKVGAGGRVDAFVEKPSPGRSLAGDLGGCNTVNAGTYVLEPSVLDRIAPRRKVSVEREVFPAMVRDATLFAQVVDTYWIDTGTPDQFIRCQIDLLGSGPDTYMAGATLGADGVWWHPGTHGVGGSVRGTVRAPALVGHGAVVEHGAEVSESVVGAGCRVEAGARVHRSVLAPGSVVGSDAVVEDSIVGHRAWIGPKAHVADLTVVAEGARVPEGESLYGARVEAEPNQMPGESGGAG